MTMVKRGKAALMGAVFLFGSSGVAFGDMIIIASTVAEHKKDSVVPSGTYLTVPKGASVTLIDVDQNTLVITAPGGKIPGNPTDNTEPGSSSSFMDILKDFFAGSSAPKIGATRGAKPSVEIPTGDCDTLPDSLPVLLQNDCEERAMVLWRDLPRQLKPNLYIGTSKGVENLSYRFGETIRLEAQANFDAYLYCFHQGSDGTTTRFIPYLGSTPRLNANAVGKLPGSLAPEDFYISAGAPHGLDQIDCYATEYDIAGQFPGVLSGNPDLGKNKLRKDVKAVFDKVGTKVAHASIEIEVRN